jgi:hypothetical protein
VSEKLIEEMTLEEAQSEYRKWDKKIAEATGWGAHLTAADEFRREAKLRILRLGGEVPK